jgi:hypothetical protein
VLIMSVRLQYKNKLQFYIAFTLKLRSHR